MKVFLSALTALLLLLLSSSGYASDERLIIVNGVAEKSLDPNMIQLSVEVWSKANTAKHAQSLAAQQFKSLKQVFEDFKIKKEDLQTDNYTLTPDYEYDQKTRQNKMIGFRVSQNLSVILRKVEEAGGFIDALVSDKKSMDAGVNVNSISWDSDKRTQVETGALADAVRAAKVKAEEIAKAAGVRIKGVARISHGVSAAGGGGPQFRNLGAKMMAAEAATPTEISAGQIKVRVEVSAEYEIN